MFAKVFKSIFDSSIADDPQVRHMFMDLLVLADQDGVVDMTHAAVAARTRLPKEDVVRWIEALEQPDAESRCPDEGGRRLIRLDPSRSWGWRIVNFRRYRESATREMLRMSEAERKRAARRRYATGATPPHTPPKKTQEVEEEGERESDMSGFVPDLSGTQPDASGNVRDMSRTNPDTPETLALWPTLAEVLTRAEMRGICRECAEKWWHLNDSRAGCDSHGQPIRRWESSLIAFAATWRAVESQSKPRAQSRRVITEADHAKGFFHNTPFEKEHLEAKARAAAR